MSDLLDESASVEGDKSPSGSSIVGWNREAEAKARVISVRGTEEGLVIRIDGRAEWAVIRRDIEEFLGDRRKYFEGGEVAVEWLDRLPTKEQSAELELLLREQYSIEIIGRRKKGNHVGTGRATKGRTNQKSGITVPLFELTEAVGGKSEASNPEAEMAASLGLEMPKVKKSKGSEPQCAEGEMPVENGGESEGFGRKYMKNMARILGDEVFYDEDANAKVVFGTLRSGQKIETPFSLVIIGDVNPGADLIAGGDIFVLGGLRGTAHASAYDEDSMDRVIIALNMQPMQLRIGSVISRGSDEMSRGMEIAHIEDRRIVVEPYNARIISGKKRPSF